tara:strand:+ start:91975 stop:93471 length:1497 start_codon:yes stop_codon:yes gene_type:complete
MTDGDKDLRSRTLSSLGWQLCGVGGQRLLQLGSFMLLARLLPEKEIGLFIVLLTGIGVIESLTLFVGEQTTISSQRLVNRAYLNTVFTIRLLRGLVICGILCALSWPLAWFFEDAENPTRYWLPGLFLVLAPNGVLDALQSPARAARMKGLDFRRIVVGDFSAAVLGAAVTVALAFAWHDVWAMLIGHLATTVLRSGISYLSAPHKPAFCFDRPVLKELLHYNIGAAGAPFLLLLIFTAPAFILGKVLNSLGSLAIFDFAGRIAKIPEDIFLRVLGPVAIPAYAQLRNDNERLGRAWLQAVRAFVLIGTPMTLAMAWCGNALPAAVFGPRYGSIGGLFALQALHGGIAGLMSVIGPLFWAVGKPQLDRTAQFFRCIAMYGLGIPGALWFGVTGFAAATCIAITIGLLLSIWFALTYLNLRFTQLLAVMRDGALVGGALALCLISVDLIFAPTAIGRIIAAGATGGPIMAVLAIKMLRNRKPQAGLPEPAVDLPTDPSL